MIRKLKTSVIASFGSLMLAAGMPVKADLLEEVTEASAIPEGLLLLKYHPETIPEKQVISLAGQQIGKDWRANEYSKDDHVYMFRGDQIAERPTQFTSRKVAPEYRQQLIEIANSVPDELYFEEVSRLGFRMYKDGKLQYEEQHAGGLGEFAAVDRMSFMSDHEKLDLPSLGSYEVLRSIPELRGELSSSLPETIQRLETIRGVRGHLALDRKPIIPAIEMDADTAEALWRKPDCNPVGIAYIGDMPRDEAEAKAEECRKKLEKYGEAEIRTIYHLAISDVVLEDRNWIVKAKVKSVEVHGPGQRLLQRYSASDLLPAEDSWMLEKKEKQDEISAKQQELDDQRSTMRENIASVDIVGLDLSMSFSEAEAAVRKSMEVARVRERDRSSRTTPFFDDFRTYENESGTERMKLHKPTPDSNKLVAIGRMLDLPETAEWEDVKKQLIDRYGEPTKEYGTDLSWNEEYKNDEHRKYCRPSLGFTRPARNIIEGEDRGVYEQYSSFSIGTTSAIVGDRHDHYTAMAKECSPQLHAKFNKGNKKLMVILVDFGSYASENLKEMPSPKEVQLDL